MQKILSRIEWRIYPLYRTICVKSFSLSRTPLTKMAWKSCENQHFRTYQQQIKSINTLQWPSVTQTLQEAEIHQSSPQKAEAQRESPQTSHVHLKLPHSTACCQVLSQITHSHPLMAMSCKNRCTTPHPYMHNINCHKYSPTEYESETDTENSPTIEKHCHFDIMEVHPQSGKTINCLDTQSNEESDTISKEHEHFIPSLPQSDDEHSFTDYESNTHTQYQCQQLALPTELWTWKMQKYPLQHCCQDYQQHHQQHFQYHQKVTNTAFETI